MEFKSLDPLKMDINPFKMIGKEWMLITATDGQKVNSMTASWGGFGVMWNKNVAFVVIRESRFTKELVDKASGFSLTFFDNEEHAKMLAYMGSVSGRDEDKIKKFDLTVDYSSDIPFIKEANKVIICEKLSKTTLDKDQFLKDEIKENWYPNGDYHDLYIAHIKEILVADN